MDENSIREAVARAWCHPKNSAKIMDPDLVEAAVQELLKLQPKDQVK